MAEEFNWKQFMTDQQKVNPILEEGGVTDPRTGEPIPINTAPVYVSPPEPEPVSQEILNADIIAPKFTVESESPVAGYSASELRVISDHHIDDVLRMALERKASDIHLTVGLPPMIRLDGEIIPLPFHPLSPRDSRRLIYDVLTNEQLERFETHHELDFGYSVKDLARFRFNVYQQRGSVAGALRTIPTKIPAFETLGLPAVIREMCKRTSGLILVTGPTGSGKTTTIASMIDDLNDHFAGHILTIEDPIEYIHKHKRCMVNQRELHHDTFSFHHALRAVLREDPDIVLVGELRDLETIEAALTLSETGHLVFGTLHTRNAPATVDRIIDVFPSDQQDQIRVLLGNTLEGVVAQQLLPKLGGGRMAAIEVMLGTPAIKNLIREGKTHQMYSIIEMSGGHGMQTMDKCLSDMYRAGYVSFDECLMRSIDKDNFTRLAKGAAA
jgi:twitching motility protein PilT